MDDAIEPLSASGTLTEVAEVGSFSQKFESSHRKRRPAREDRQADAAPPDSSADDADPQDSGAIANVRIVPVDDTDSAEPEPHQIIEALLFASDTPLTAAKLAELSGVGTARDARNLIDSLNANYAEARLSFRIEALAGGFQMLTLAAYRPWLSKLATHRSRGRITPAALETLSIVAYKQPVIRADVEAIRGVACGEVLNRLREMGLVKMVGRAEVVGRPMLFGTTRKFLEIFGLANLDDLPAMETLTLRRAVVEDDAPIVEPEDAADGHSPASDCDDQAERAAAGA